MIWATWNGAFIAESNRTTLVEGSHVFPIGDVSTELLVDSEKLALCMWKPRRAATRLRSTARSTSTALGPIQTRRPKPER